MLDSKKIKKKILEIAFKANKGHIGSALSISDLVVSIFNFMNQNQNIDEDKYSLTLSKGHAALALYCCLNEINLISDHDLLGYESDDSLLGTHPDPSIPWVNFLGGSLGQGFSFAAGLALADFISNKKRTHFVILSDSELNAGVTWEVAGILGTRRINNIVVLLDNNKQQALDLTKNVVNYENLESTFQSFGWEVEKVNGHDQGDIINKLNLISSKPKLIIADTKFGAGISFMEAKIEWHYLPLTKDLYDKALKEIDEI